MATALARRNGRFARAPRRGPSPLVAKLKDRLRSANRRAASAMGGGGNRIMRDVVAAGSAALLGKLEQGGTLPARIGPVDSAFVIGGLGAFVAPRFVKGKVGAMVHDAALGALCVAGYRLGTGQPLLGEDELSGGGWTDVE